jgi:WD40 repeat protein
VQQEGGTSYVLLQEMPFLSIDDVPEGIVLLDNDTGDVQAFFESPNQKWVRTIAFAANGQYLAAAGDDQTIFVWDLDSSLGPSCVGSSPPGITSLVYSPDRRTIAAGTTDGTVALVDASQRTVSRIVRVGESTVVGVDFSPRANLLLTTSQEGLVRLWTYPAMELQIEFRAHEYELVGGALSADGRHFVSVGYRDPPPVCVHDIRRAEVTVWSLKDGRHLFSRELPDLGPIRAVAATRDHRKLAISFGCLVIVADISITPTFRRVLKNLKAEYSRVAFSNHDDYLLVTNVGYGMRLVRCEDRTSLSQFSAVHDGPTALAFNPAGIVLARGTAYWNDIEMYEIPSGTVVNCLVGHQNSVTALAFSADGATLVSGGADGTIKFWEARSGTLQASLVIPPAGRE